MNKANKAVVAVASSAGALGAWIAYDYKTCHPMREIAGYDVKGAFVRLHNAVRSAILAPPTFTTLRLQDYDGENKRQVYFAANGLVYDATGSEMFDSVYSLWKGKDASFCLAKMSMDASDIDRTDWETLSKDDIASLRSWTPYFNQKYLIKGRMKDFPTSSLEKKKEIDQNN